MSDDVPMIGSHLGDRFTCASPLLDGPSVSILESHSYAQRLMTWRETGPFGNVSLRV